MKFSNSFCVYIIQSCSFLIVHFRLVLAIVQLLQYHLPLGILVIFTQVTWNHFMVHAELSHSIILPKDGLRQLHHMLPVCYIHTSWKINKNMKTLNELLVFAEVFWSDRNKRFWVGFDFDAPSVFRRRPIFLGSSFFEIKFIWIIFIALLKDRVTGNKISIEIHFFYTSKYFL